MHIILFKKGFLTMMVCRHTCVSMPNRTTVFLSGSELMNSMTSGIAIENSVFEKMRAELMSISDTVLPSPACGQHTPIFIVSQSSCLNMPRMARLNKSAHCDVDVFTTYQTFRVLFCGNNRNLEYIGSLHLQ